MNKVILFGRISKDIEVRYTQSGKCIANFSIAVDNGKTDNNGKRGVYFFDCVAWEKTGELIGNHFVKGSQILLSEASLQNRSYEAQDGSKRHKTEVLVRSFEFVGSKQTRTNDDHPATAVSGGSGAESFGSEVFPDEEIPF